MFGRASPQARPDLPRIGSPPQLRRGLLGRGPSRGGCGLSPSANSEALPAFEPPRQQRRWLLSASLSKERGHFHPWWCRPAACASPEKSLVVVPVLVLEEEPRIRVYLGYA